MNPIRQFVQNIRARIAKHYVIKEVTNVLKIDHARELSEANPEMWPQLRSKHAAQIEGIAAGKLDIVDRRSWAFPYLPSTLTRLQQPIIKLVPFNLRRFARTPVPRRAINLIKNAVTSMDWDIVALPGDAKENDTDQLTRIDVAKKSFAHPNNDQSFQGLLEEGIDDFCIMGAMVIEPQITPDPNRPIKLWNVDASTIRFFSNWTESQPDEPKYAQMTGLKGERGIVVFYADELMYIKDNPSVETPFGTSKMEVAFKSITAFLGVQEMSGRAGSDQVHRTWLWWENGAQGPNLDIVRRHLTNDLEGQSMINLMAGMKAPEVIDVQAVQEGDLLLPWQEMCIRMIAAGFDMSAQAFLERDINRSTGEVLSDMDFRSAVVPTAVRIAEYFTRFILHRKLGWTDLEFKFLNIDDPDLTTKMDILTKMYSSNALTPNGMLRELGKPTLSTPYADLTQFEAILVNTQAAAGIQDANAAKANDRQQQNQQQQMEQYQKMQQQQGDDQQQEDSQQASAAPSGPSKPGAPKAPAGPKPLKMPPLKMPKLPQMPMAGSRYSAQQIAAMSLSELKAAQASGAVPSDPNTLTNNMQNQDPLILEQMAPEIQDYLDKMKQQQAEEDAKAKPQITPADRKLQEQKYKKSKHIPAQIEQVFTPTAKQNKSTRSYAPAFADKRNKNLGREIATTDVTKANTGRVKIRRPRTS